MSKEIAELFDVVERLRGAEDVWERIRALNGDNFVLRFCCNSQCVRQILIAHDDWPQRGFMTMEHTRQVEKGMPHEASAIIECCRTDPKLKATVGSLAHCKFDLMFFCGGFGVKGWQIKQVS